MPGPFFMRCCEVSLLEDLVEQRERAGDDLYVMLTTSQIDGAIAALRQVEALGHKLDLMSAHLLERDRQIARLRADLEDWQDNPLQVP